MRDGEQAGSPHGLCPQGRLQVFHHLVPYLCLLLIKGVQTLHLWQGVGSRRTTFLLAPYSPPPRCDQGYARLSKCEASGMFYETEDQAEKTWTSLSSSVKRGELLAQPICQARVTFGSPNHLSIW